MGLEWLVLALSAAVLNGLSTLAAKPSADHLGPRMMAVGATLIEGVAFGVAGLVSPRAPLSAGTDVILAALAAGFLGAIGYVFFFAGMRRGSVGLVGTISATAPLLTVLLSVSLLNEVLGGLQVLGIATTMACVLLLTIHRGPGTADRRAAVAFSLGGFLTWGLWGFLVKASVGTLGERSLFLLLAAGYLGIAAAAALFRRNGPAPQPDASRRIWAIGLFVFLSGSVAAIILTAAYDAGPAALVAPVSATYPVIATLGAWAILREKPGWRVGAALVLFVIGISLLSAS
jgi:drug/metabolite transporter (DMT)-like permease